MKRRRISKLPMAGAILLMVIGAQACTDPMMLSPSMAQSETCEPEQVCPPPDDNCNWIAGVGWICDPQNQP